MSTSYLPGTWLLSLPISLYSYITGKDFGEEIALTIRNKKKLTPAVKTYSNHIPQPY
jgi:hypothetical protein